jgi:hypothetical protein
VKPAECSMCKRVMRSEKGVAWCVRCDRALPPVPVVPGKGG